MPKKEVMRVKMVRLNIQLPADLKAKLDAKRASGYTASGFIRYLLERELNATPKGRNGTAIPESTPGGSASAGPLIGALPERGANKR
jgi:hypothetical protein